MMKKAGEILRETRTQKNISIEDVFEGTKIRPSYIEAIERGEYAIFHSQTTIKGFLKSYATFLHLNPENIIAVYRREQNMKEKSVKSKWNFKLPKIQLSSVIFIVISAIIIIGAVTAYFAFQYIQVTNPPKFDVIEPADGANVTDNKITVRILAEKGVDVYINNRQITSVDDKGNYFTSVDLVEGQNSIDITAINGFKKQSTKKLTITRTSPQQVVVMQDYNVLIKSVYSKTITFAYQIDSGQSQSINLEPGKSINLVGKQSLSINGPSNINSLVEIFVNQAKISLLPGSPKQQITFGNPSTINIVQ